MNCRGNTAGSPKDWCKVDSEKILKDLATQEGTRVIQKEANKLLEKLFKKQNKSKN